MNAAPDQIAYRRRWAVYSSYLAAFGMVVCFAAIFIQFIKWLVPDLDMRGMLVACALTALEAFISYWLVRHLPTAEKQLAFYRVTEFVILLVALKVFTELRAGPGKFSYQRHTLAGSISFQCIEWSLYIHPAAGHRLVAGC